MTECGTWGDSDAPGAARPANVGNADGVVNSGGAVGFAAAGFRNFPDSKTITAPRISEVYTKGTLTLARLGREAPRHLVVEVDAAHDPAPSVEEDHRRQRGGSRRGKVHPGGDLTGVTGNGDVLGTEVVVLRAEAGHLGPPLLDHRANVIDRRISRTSTAVPVVIVDELFYVWKEQDLSRRLGWRLISRTS